MTDFAHTATAQENRAHKATRLARECRAHGMSAEQARSMDARDRRWIERVAGVNTASDETWALALVELADREAAEPRIGSGERW